MTISILTAQAIDTATEAFNTYLELASAPLEYRNLREAAWKVYLDADELAQQLGGFRVLTPQE